ncbi:MULTISPECIES: PsbP-related protein [Methanobacterium]|jgi:hypothetical protein|uniref:Uncharacterized protein n=1 Tax=Methanobacterium formicicum TaxID=2162 RepID=A0A090I0U0_METFO|nr:MULTISPECIES: PsbP-related protein [Methanobacterium]KUK74670.1 MAG: hypothetical protein XD90_1015 [Methanobacterium sp. 42_16]MBF4474633.1 hypothetical protein [Methanobacterium formicicum]MDD4810447.1 PsbP-related protein [Methanobacterium formicicum]MDH2660045.1 PsbP-related protein [Methanobacterium formicicum]CEA12513.1 hypothetical protein DSM1535_0147 [Methanobacterium formicicum]
MDKKLLGCLILSMVAVVVVSGCTSTSNLVNFNANGVKFNYPDTWKVNSTPFTTLTMNTSSQSLVNLYKPNNAYDNVDLTSTFQLFLKEENLNFNDLNSQIELQRNVSKDMGYTKIQERNLTIDGAPAYEFVVAPFSMGEASFIYFIKGGKLYEMLFYVPEGIHNRQNIETIRPDMDIIIKSFTINPNTVKLSDVEKPR